MSVELTVTTHEPVVVPPPTYNLTGLSEETVRALLAVSNWSQYAARAVVEEAGSYMEEYGVNENEIARGLREIVMVLNKSGLRHDRRW